MPATPAWPPKSAPRLFVAPPLAPGAGVALDGAQAHYLARVMRVAPGDAVVLCDDVTGEWAARVESVGKRDVMLAVDRQLRPLEQPADITLCAALIKKPRFDWVLEKATELGVRRIQPVITRRCVADALNAERARALIAEAAEQCARTALPVLEAPVRLDGLLRSLPGGQTLIFADEAGGDAALPVLQNCAAPLSLLVGPEGGFDDAERDAIRAHAAARAVTLGANILRAETAAVALCTLALMTRN